MAAKKLSKSVDGGILNITYEDGSQKQFDINSLNDSIKFNLSMHGLSQKLGDAAAGKDQEAAVKAIDHVWEGLTKGDWTVRAPAGEKLTKKELGEKLDNSGLSEKEIAKAKELFAKLGITI